MVHSGHHAAWDMPVQQEVSLRMREGGIQFSSRDEDMGLAVGKQVMRYVEKHRWQYALALMRLGICRNGGTYLCVDKVIYVFPEEMRRWV